MLFGICYEVVPFAKGTEITCPRTWPDRSCVTKLSPSRRGLKSHVHLATPSGGCVTKLSPSRRGLKCNLPDARHIADVVTKLSPSRRGLKSEDVEACIYQFAKLRSCPLREGD